METSVAQIVIPEPSGSMKWVWVAVGSVVLFVVIVMVTFAVLFGSLMGPLMQRTLSAQVPKDFPVYPGATGGARSVAISDCTYVDVAWTTPDSPVRVTTFYASHLDAPPSAILSQGPDHFEFVERGAREFWGRVVIQPKAGRTQIALAGRFTTDAFGKRNPDCARLDPRPSPR